MESHGLKYAARYFGLSSPDRYGRRRTDILTWTMNLRHLSNMRSTMCGRPGLEYAPFPSSFHLAQMVPCSYGTVTRIGAAAKIELLLVREYLRQKHSLRSHRGCADYGRYTDMFFAGSRADCPRRRRILYPSLMITKGISPATTSSRSSRDAPYSYRQRLALKRRCVRRRMKRLARIWMPSVVAEDLDQLFYGYLGIQRTVQ